MTGVWNGQLVDEIRDLIGRYFTSALAAEDVIGGGIQQEVMYFLGLQWVEPRPALTHSLTSPCPSVCVCVCERECVCVRESVCVCVSRGWTALCVAQDEITSPDLPGQPTPLPCPVCVCVCVCTCVCVCGSLSPSLTLAVSSSHIQYMLRPVSQTRHITDPLLPPTGLPASCFGPGK